MENDIVSITVPTLNSEATIGACLRSLKEQSYTNKEVILVDSYSHDKTLEIANDFNVKVVKTYWSLLGARYLGVKGSKGNVVLLLDSDQILEKTALERGIKLLNKGFDMLALEETSFNPRTWVEKLFQADRELLNEFGSMNLDPCVGVILPRLFRKSLLDQTFARIPRELFPIVVGHDHSIIYYEAYKVSKRVGILPNSVFHIEPRNMIEVWQKNYRFSRTIKELMKTGYYNDLVKSKIRLRRGFWSDPVRAMKSDLLMLFKGMAYELGWWLP
jgi:glycosyltransferase involved in cell wall biosynthesis